MKERKEKEEERKRKKKNDKRKKKEGKQIFKTRSTRLPERGGRLFCRWQKLVVSVK